jgi:hypothetical protein
MKHQHYNYCRDTVVTLDGVRLISHRRNRLLTPLPRVPQSQRTRIQRDDMDSGFCAQGFDGGNSARIERPGVSLVGIGTVHSQHLRGSCVSLPLKPLVYYRITGAILSLVTTVNRVRRCSKRSYRSDTKLLSLLATVSRHHSDSQSRKQLR